MRVALISHNARIGDAIGRQVAAKAAFFRDRGADIRVFVESTRDLHPLLDPFAQCIAADVPLEPLAAELRDGDLVCIEYGQHYRLAEIAPLLSGGRAKVLFEYYGITPPEFAAGNAEALRAGQRWRGLAWFADEVSVHSRFAQEELCTATALPAERTVHAPLWMETTPSNVAPRFLDDRLGLAHARIALYVGRVAPNKRVPVLIEALARLADDGRDVHAVIIGDIGGAYGEEAARCRSRSAELGVAERVHFLGSVSDAELAAAYARADVFVMPSVHEGFCMPVIEAMARGVAVIAAHAGALPETMAGAGLAFPANSADDLAGQLRRVFAPSPALRAMPKRVAFVTPRFGSDVLGGAERSLRSMARALAESGWGVEVFALGDRDSTTMEDGLLIRRFAAEQSNETERAAVFALTPTAQCDDMIAQRFLELTIGSRALVEVLRARQGDFAAVVAGPYGNGLCSAVTAAMPAKTLLVPCFHDEPLARTTTVRKAYHDAAGLLFHSPEERDFAQSTLGVCHPNTVVIGAWLDAARHRPIVRDEGKNFSPSKNQQRTSAPARGRAGGGRQRPYVLYSGRYCREKNLPLLIDWQQRYEHERPERFEFWFTGSGDIGIPRQPGWRDLGFLSEIELGKVMAGAAAVVQLSRYESLSLAVLDAWRQSTPVIGHRGCAPVAGLVARCGGGRCVETYEEFRDCLDHLHQSPQAWHGFGAQGEALVRAEFSSRSAFVERLESALERVGVPLVEQLRERSRRRAADFGPEVWEAFFSAQVDRLLHQPRPRSVRLQAATALGDEGRGGIVRPRNGRLEFRTRLGARKAPVEIENAGDEPLMPAGPCRSLVWSMVLTEGLEPAMPAAAAPLADWVLPGRTLPMLLRVRMPKQPGDYRLALAVRREEDGMPQHWDCKYPLVVEATATAERSDSLLEHVHTLLAEAEKLQELPAGYADVTTGPLAALKRKLKAKLLHQFKTMYVDVLSRQQSQFNRQVAGALSEVAECVAALESAVVDGRPAAAPARDLEQLAARLTRSVRAAVRRITSLEERLERLEALAARQSPARTQE